MSGVLGHTRLGFRINSPDVSGQVYLPLPLLFIVKLYIITLVVLRHTAILKRLVSGFGRLSFDQTIKMSNGHMINGITVKVLFVFEFTFYNI